MLEQDVAHDTESTQESQDSSATSPTNEQTSQDDQSNEAAVAQAVAELEKLGKFKFQGQEWTAKDLEKAILRQKDYTQKTQSLAEEKRTFEKERESQKFYENLHYDLRKVEANPELAKEFIKVYPEKFHSYLKDVLSQTQTQDQPQSPGLDIDTLSKLQRLENFYNEQQKMLHEQDVAKNIQMIDSKIGELLKKYPDAIPDLAIAQVYEATQGLKKGEQISADVWEKAFKSSHEKINTMLKAKYGNLVKQQTQANAKARDVDSGGGTVGRAPQKFRSLKEVTDFAVNDITKR